MIERGDTRGNHGSFVGCAVHGEFANVFIGVPDDDVDLRRVETEKSHRGGQRN